MKSKLTLIALTCIVACQTSAAELPELDLDIEHITVSGLSSGGFMANQFHVAHSQWVTGAGIIAAGPYYCAQNSIKTALSLCVAKAGDSSRLEALRQQADEWEKAGLIDSVENLRDDRVYILHGQLDKRVSANVTNQLASQYSDWVSQEAVQYDTERAFNHHFPTQNNGHACSASEAPFIGNCDFDAAGAMFRHILGTDSPVKDTSTGSLYPVDQQQLGGEDAASLADTGYLYVPPHCESGTVCQIHVSFHGCNQQSGAVGDAYARGTGINRWADANNLVVLYPQTKASMLMPLNPQACWDWWGYTDEHYANKQGPQIKAVANMIRALESK